MSQFRPSGDKITLAYFFTQPDLRIAGRLDYDSEGLLLLSTDGQLVQRITHPRHKEAKSYCVQVEGIPAEEALAQLARGVHLNDGLTRPAQVRKVAEPPWLWPRNPPVRYRASIPTAWLEITLTEGRNRQVRRMTAAVGHPALRLIRTRIGPWSLTGLRPGEHREEDN